MAFLFRKTKSDLVKPAKELLLRLWQAPKSPKTDEEIGKLLQSMKTILQGTHEMDSNPEAVGQLVTSMMQEDFLYMLAHSMHLLEFVPRKDSQAIFSNALRFRPAGHKDEDTPVLAYALDTRPELIVELCRGYAHRDSSMPCGAVLREILKNEHVAAIVLYDESGEDEPAIHVNGIDLDKEQSGEGVFWKLFRWIDEGAFEVSTDAFTTFRELLTKHKAMVARYLMANFDLFFENYNTILIGSDSYVTKRQSIKLLGEILLDRANYNVMTAYVEKGAHLKVIMNLLKDDRKMVQYEAFHVFKVFVANPNKSESVKYILIQNRERLLKFLPGFLEDRTDDEQFHDEKQFLIRQIDFLPLGMTITNRRQFDSVRTAQTPPPIKRPGQP